MARETGKTLELTAEEVTALQTIVTDWINEGLTQPPYDEATASLMKKLEIGAGPTRPGTAAIAAEAPEAPALPPPTPNLG